MSDGIGSSFSISGLLGLSPQAMQQTPMTPQGIPSGIDQGLQSVGLPGMSSIVQGAMGGAGANGGIGGHLGSLLGQIAQGSSGAVQQLQSGQMSPMQFLQTAANQARSVIGGSAAAGQGGSAQPSGGGGGAAPAPQAPAMPMRRPAPQIQGLLAAPQPRNFNR